MPQMESIVLGGGCFWCIQAFYRHLPEIHLSECGYAGGTTPNPTYEQVCTGSTGHAEVVLLQFDPAKITLSKILDRFFTLHDPTQVNRQGNDVGTQYRSIILYTDDNQLPVIEEAISKVAKSRGKIATKVEKLEAYYRAEEYHQNYYEHNSTTNSYCSRVIKPKLDHMKELEAKGHI